jgi:hypothetical protein
MVALSLTSCSDDESSYLKRGTDELSFTYLNSTKELVVKSNTKWTATADEDWITCTPASGSGTGTEQYVNITVDQNDGDAREGTVYISDGTKKLAVAVSQEDGVFSLGAPSVPAGLNINESASESAIQIPYYKSKPGYTATVTATMTGDGTEGLAISALDNYPLEVGEGTLSLPFSGVPTAKGLVSIKLNVKINGADVDEDYDLSFRVKTGGEVAVSIYKLLPRLAVFDWGKYQRGSGTNGDNGTSRAFHIELAESQYGAATRYVDATTTEMLVANMFFENNRFAFGGLTPNTTYWFRIVAKEVGSNKQDSDTTYIEFTTPVEDVLDSNVILYKDFDDFNIGGCSIYKAYGMDITTYNEWKAFNPSNLSKVHTVAHPMVCLRFNMFSIRTNKTHYLGPVISPEMWKQWWGDYDYTATVSPGWDGFWARPMTGGVTLGGATADGSLETPPLEALGDTPTDITFTCHTAPYYEDYHSWGEDNNQHYIEVSGPGEIVSCNTKVQIEEGAKKVLVQCVSNVDNSSTEKTPLHDYMVTTEHVVKISGATKDTRIIIESAPYATTGIHPRVVIDDIKIVKN